MPVLGNIVKPQTSGSGANARIELDDGMKFGRITSILFFREHEGRKIEQNHLAYANAEQKARVYVELTGKYDAAGKPIVLSRKFNVYLSEKAAFAKMIAALSGIRVTDRERLESFDTDALIGFDVAILTTYNADTGYTNIDAFSLPPGAKPVTLAA